MTDPTTPGPGSAVALYGVPRTPAERWQYAENLAPARTLPAELRGSAPDVFLRVEYGIALGLPPIAALTAVHVIDGKPSASAGLISGVIRGAGHRLRIWTEPDPDAPGEVRAVATIVRRDDPDHEYRVVWDVARAIAAGLLRRLPSGQLGTGATRPGAWDKYRPAMLKARAVTEVGRDACEDVLLGVHYTPEELGAVVAEDGTPVVIDGEVVRDASPAPAPAYGPAAQTPPPAAPAVETLSVDVVVDGLAAAWADLDLDELGLLFQRVKASTLAADTPAPHPVTGEVQPLADLFRAVGTAIRAGERYPDGDGDGDAKPDTPAPAPVAPSDHAARGPLPADEDPWATPPPDAHPDDLPVLGVDGIVDAEVVPDRDPTDTGRDRPRDDEEQPLRGRALAEQALADARKNPRPRTTTRKD